MKRYIKILLLTILFIFFTFSAPAVLADESYEIDDIISSGRDFLGAGESDTHEYVNQKSLKKASDNIYYIFFIVGFILTAIIGSILGIQFIISGVEGKAKVKEALIPYVIGCVVIFGAFGIWKISINIFKGVDKNLPATESTYQIDYETTDPNWKPNYGKCECGADLQTDKNQQFCPTGGPGSNGKTIDGVKHSWPK